LKQISSRAWYRRLVEPDRDLLIVGGGIYGCGIAQAAAASGYSVTLIEKNNIASGASSQSTKLIHGGLRYLEQVKVRLVFEALREREMLLKIAPELVQREWFFIPIYADSRRPWWFVACGLLLYWLLSGGRSRFRRLHEGEWQTVLPGLKTEGLCAVLAYEDAATDDAALTRAVAASAKAYGCRIFEDSGLASASYDGNFWLVRLDDGREMRARLLVNASGPWMHEVCSRIIPAPPEVAVRLIQGTHLLLDRPCRSYIYTESVDGRVMFFRPWKGKMLVGTTEVELAEMPLKPFPTKNEVSTILATHNLYFPGSPCSEADILDTFCGVRMLPAGSGAFAASREALMLADDERLPAYLGVYGGKLTTYRSEAQKALALIARHFPEPQHADTRSIPLGDSGKASG